MSLETKLNRYRALLSLRVLPLLERARQYLDGQILGIECSILSAVTSGEITWEEALARCPGLEKFSGLVGKIVASAKAFD